MKLTYNTQVSLSSRIYSQFPVLNHLVHELGCSNTIQMKIVLPTHFTSHRVENISHLFYLPNTNQKRTNTLK